MKSTRHFILGLTTLHFGISIAAASIPSHISAKRADGTSWKEHARTLQQEIARKAPLEDVPTATAFDSRKPGAQLADSAFVPTVDSMEALMERFTYARDTRFIDDPSVPNFLRRLSWMYPDDGCFMRAGYANILMKDKFQQDSARVFVFGDLIVNSPHATDPVQWWYHTAPIVKLADQIYVLDPALYPKNPVTIKDWVNTQGVTFDTTDVSLCDANSFSPDEACFGSDTDEESLKTYAPIYLGAERYRQLELHNNDEAVVNNLLGEFPPWLTDLLALAIKF